MLIHFSKKLQREGGIRGGGLVRPRLLCQNSKIQKAGTHQPLFLEAEARKKKIVGGVRYITLDPTSLQKHTYW